MIHDEFEIPRQNNFDQQLNLSENEKQSNQVEKNYTSKKNPISKTNISNSITMNQLTPQMKVIIDQVIERTVNKTLSEIQKGLSDSSDSQNSANNENLSRFQSPSEKIEVTMNESNRWNFGNIEFFDLNFEEKSVATEEPLKHSNKNTYYKDVHVFVKRIKEMTIVLKTKMVKRNLFSCLRDTALM